ncbi:hypothetical protein F2Q69_00030496 [Brassica cretica]|uniref:Uncharacterized protein n=1 Tax=Brassica cretica TaxID=69181 RepID=A0A8S9S751_BRACR|nr:hypothetical protein F2Q69_00030496 [Brassica cretica]
MSSEVYYRSWMDKPHLDPNTNLLTEEYVWPSVNSDERGSSECTEEHSTSEVSEERSPSVRSFSDELWSRVSAS